MLLHNHPEYVSCACEYNAVNYDAKSLTTQRTTLVSWRFSFSCPVPFFWARLHLPRVHYGLVPDFRAPIYPRWRSHPSALAARAKIRLPCTLKHRVQHEYNSLLVNALNRIFKSNLSLNNFKWLLTKLKLSCVRNIIPRSRRRLWNGYPVLNQELQNHDPVGRHIPV